MALAETLGWTATVLFTVCYVPQIIKTLRTNKIDGVSFSLFAIQFVANIIALWYALLIAQPPLQVKYLLGILFLLICMGAYLRVWWRIRHVVQA